MQLMNIENKRKEEKRRKKRDAKQQLMRSALNSGDAQEFLKQHVIDKLKIKGKIEKVFAEIDTDGSGTIDFEELKVCLKGMGYPMSKDDMVYMMSQLDADGDGEVTMEEFKKFLGIADTPTRKSRKVKQSSSDANFSETNMKRLDKHSESAGALPNISKSRALSKFKQAGKKVIVENNKDKFQKRRDSRSTRKDKSEKSEKREKKDKKEKLEKKDRKDKSDKKEKKDKKDKKSKIEPEKGFLGKMFG